MTKIAAALALAGVLALAAGPVHASAGQVLFVSGPVTVERPAPLELKKGDPVEVGDVIVTGEKARAQLLMNDGARIALRAGSRYKVDAFQLPPVVGAPTQATASAAQGVSVATLLNGGFRTSTGAIGKGGAGTYEVRAPIGTLGIRGTDYTAVWCEGNCRDVPGLQPSDVVRDGMYLAVNAGSILFRYGGREAVVETGQVFFIAAGDAAPEPLDRVPAWLLQDGAGELATGAQDQPEGAIAGLPDLSGRRPPPDGSQPPTDSSAGNPDDPNAYGEGVARPITGTVGGQQDIDLTSGQLPRGPNNPPPGTPQLPPPSSAPPPPPTHQQPPPPGSR
ncbi:MAG: FecR family protein [Steroidobacteraceae bacterium]